MMWAARRSNADLEGYQSHVSTSIESGSIGEAAALGVELRRPAAIHDGGVLWPWSRMV